MLNTGKYSEKKSVGQEWHLPTERDKRHYFTSFDAMALVQSNNNQICLYLNTTKKKQFSRRFIFTLGEEGGGSLYNTEKLVIFQPDGESA